VKEVGPTSSAAIAPLVSPELVPVDASLVYALLGVDRRTRRIRRGIQVTLVLLAAWICSPMSPTGSLEMLGAAAAAYVTSTACGHWWRRASIKRAARDAGIDLATAERIIAKPRR
jgi:hypothetical protein